MADEDLDLVTVLQATDTTQLLVVKALFEDEGIPCIVLNEPQQDLLGLGRGIFGFNPAVGPVVVQVPREHAARARELLETRTEPLSEDEEPAGDD
jgi:hypothetical protein